MAMRYTHVQELLPEIKAMLSEGRSQREIAEHLGLRDKSREMQADLWLPKDVAVVREAGDPPRPQNSAASDEKV